MKILILIQIYEVEDSDGYNSSFSANVIVENTFAEVDDVGNRFQLLSEIVGHKSNGTELTQ